MENQVRNKGWFRWLAAVVVVAVAAVGYVLSAGGGKTAPDVTFVKLDGSRVSMQNLRGKVVLVNFWATSCVTCVKEMPDMVATYEKYKDQGLDFVAVAMSYDPPSYVVNFTETRKLPFIVVLDSQDEASRAFGDVRLTPTTFVVDKSGKMIKRYIGEPDFTKLHELIEDALAA